jgi:hypothetical protein
LLFYSITSSALLEVHRHIDVDRVGGLEVDDERFYGWWAGLKIPPCVKCLTVPAAEAVGIVQFANWAVARAQSSFKACSNCHPDNRGIATTKTTMLVIVLGIAIGSCCGRSRWPTKRGYQSSNLKIRAWFSACGMK